MDREFDRFMAKSRALTTTPPPNHVEQTQKVVRKQIQTSLRKPLYSFIAVFVVVSIYLLWSKPTFVMRPVLPPYQSYGQYGMGYTVPGGILMRQFDYTRWVKVSFCLSILLWAVLYLLMGAFMVQNGNGSDSECSDGDEPDSAGYCSS
jgi:hypothetical protein